MNTAIENVGKQNGKLLRNSYEPRRVYGICFARFEVVVAVIVKTLPCDV
jgi:t-SNARE complex subunit (syntaxin)